MNKIKRAKASSKNLLKAKYTNHKTNRLNNQTPEYFFDDISSESSEDGRRFLKNPEQRLRETVVRIQSPTTTEDENTEDLLIPFNARKPLRNFSKNPTQIVSSDKSTSSNGTKSKEVVKHLVNDNFVNELLAIRENDTIDVNKISILSLSGKDLLVDIKTEENSLKDIQTESKLIASDDQIILSVDELMHENSIDCASCHSTSRFNKSYKEKSVTEIEEYIECEDTHSYNSTKTLSDNVLPTKKMSHQLDIDNNSDETDEYSDDFENEQDLISLRKDNTRYNLPTANRSLTPQNIASIDSPGALNRKDLREIVPHKKISNKSTNTQTNDAEVQTIWSGDLPQYLNIPHSYLIKKYENLPTSTNNTTLKIKSMMSSLTSYKTLNTLTTYNPCITALDNMLKQQINLTREFLTTQRNLHETISKAISHCVTNDYSQIEKILSVSDKQTFL
ncbi:hypothetical protein MN116_001789 [Schistosoma mekongi]|uniref:DUF4614 domain-containing protein n=1 Tax=Schistosoma mekongi TaxID=38744 RepID=A0AAE2D7W6_SCHME|nr:hypothetical protein MN116_001789 [Schistosoma mekongi]